MRDRPIDQIRREMAEIRGHLAGDVGQVADAARAMTDWRTYVRRYPWLCLGGAAMVGYMLVRRRFDVFIPGLGPMSSSRIAAAKPRHASFSGSLAMMLTSLLTRRAIRAVENYASRHWGPEAKKSRPNPPPKQSWRS